MSVDYGVLTYLGWDFDDETEAKEFLLDNLELTEGEKEHLEDDVIGYLEEHSILSGTKTDLYDSDSPIIIGINLSHSYQVDEFIARLLKAKEQWDKLFPNHSPFVIREVRIY